MPKKKNHLSLGTKRVPIICGLPIAEWNVKCGMRNAELPTADCRQSMIIDDHDHDKNTMTKIGSTFQSDPIRSDSDPI